MKRLISVLSAFTALLTVFSCTTLEPTNLSSDTLPVKITVTGHARYQSYNKSGNLQDPEVVDKGTEVRIYYGAADEFVCLATGSLTELIDACKKGL